MASTDSNHALFAFDRMHLVAEVLDLFAHFINLFAGCVQLHRYDHGSILSTVFLIFVSSYFFKPLCKNNLWKIKKPTRCEWAESFFWIRLQKRPPPPSWVDR
jgi:hypothetical protein